MPVLPSDFLQDWPAVSEVHAPSESVLQVTKPGAGEGEGDGYGVGDGEGYGDAVGDGDGYGYAVGEGEGETELARHVQPLAVLVQVPLRPSEVVHACPPVSGVHKPIESVTQVTAGAGEGEGDIERLASFESTASSSRLMTPQPAREETARAPQRR